MIFATWKQGAYSARDANYHEYFKFSTRNPGVSGQDRGAVAVNDSQRELRKVNCFECRHFFITHELGHPYGCQAMGFKSREMPSSVVCRSSGEPCLLQEPKDKQPDP